MTTPPSTIPPNDMSRRLRAARLGMLMPRGLAHGIDTFILFGTLILFNRATGQDREPNNVLALIALASFFSYFLIAEWRWGRTIGKWVIGLVVVDGQGRRISFGQSLGRNLLRPFELPSMIATVLVLFTRDSQRLGDILADTYVVPVSFFGKAGFDATRTRKLESSRG